MVRDVDRRTGAALIIAGVLQPVANVRAAEGPTAFAAEAARMRAEAMASGDQPYGAVLVLDDAVVGYGPSRVVADRNTDAHAERVALWDAQRRLGRIRLDGAVVYATSRPCAACQVALAAAGVARIRIGPEAADGGAPAP